MSVPYISCIKVGGVPILPPLITPQIRQECHNQKLKALELEKKRGRNRLFKQCMEDLERLELQTRNFTDQTLESQLVFTDEQLPITVPYDMYKKLQNLRSETIDVSEYSVDGVKLITKGLDERQTPPKLIRSNSYTLESPSPILLAHLEKEARKCIELDDSESLLPRTVTDGEPPLQVIDTDISVQEVTFSTPIKWRESQLVEILNKVPQDHEHNINEILSKSEHDQKFIKEQFVSDDKSMSVSISRQSLHYSILSSDMSQPSADLHIINSKNIKNKKREDRDRAASIIQAHIRGYLVRRLIRTKKVQSLIDTIKDALLCALQLHGAEVIEESDVELHRRLIQQVSAACYAFHDVFFSLSVKEQMGIILLDRERKIQKSNGPLSASSSNLSLSSRRSSARTIR